MFWSTYFSVSFSSALLFTALDAEADKAAIEGSSTASMFSVYCWLAATEPVGPTEESISFSAVSVIVDGKAFPSILVLIK